MLPDRFPLLVVLKKEDGGYCVPHLSEEVLAQLSEIAEQYQALRAPWTREEELHRLLRSALPELAEIPLTLSDTVAELVSMAKGPQTEGVLRPPALLAPKELLDLCSYTTEDGSVVVKFDSPEQVTRTADTLLYAMETFYRY